MLTYIQIFLECRVVGLDDSLKSINIFLEYIANNYFFLRKYSHTYYRKKIRAFKIRQYKTISKHEYALEVGSYVYLSYLFCLNLHSHISVFFL